MMKKSTKRSTLLNIAIFASAVTLISLIIYSNRFNENQKSEQSEQNISSIVIAKTNTATVTLAENHKTYHKAKPLESPLAGAIHPKKPQEKMAVFDLGGDIKNDAEIEKALKRQTDNLEYELYSQDPHPNNKRALALTKEEIKELEKSKRIIY